MPTLYRITKFALQDLWRNFGLTFMTVFILVLMLLSVNTLWSLDVVTKEAVRLVRDQVTVSFYFIPEVKDESVAEVKSYVATFPEVTTIDLIAKDKVLDSFKNRHSLNPEILAALDELGGNPFGPTLTVRTREPGDYKKIIEALDVPEYEPLIEGKSFDGNETALDKVQVITSRIEKVGFGLSILFAVIAFFIIFNMIRVAIQSQRVEISIKRLVGASNLFIRGPYWLEAVFFTMLSITITIITVFAALRWVDKYIGIIFSGGFSLTEYYQSNLLYLFGIQALAVLLLTIISSSLAMRRQLKV